jgi:phosphoribosylformylglycinamidine (FGAM) synthase-like enzyme
VGGNVSLYNEAPTGPIYPTPVIGMVGRMPDARDAGRLGFARAGEEIALAGPFTPSTAASELAKLRGEPLPDGLGEIDIAAVAAAQGAVRDAVRVGALSSAHDIAEGGLAVALAECCLAGGLGAAVALAPSASTEEALFGEGSGGFLVSAAPQAIEALSAGVPVQRLGTVGGERLTVEVAEDPRPATLSLMLGELSKAYSEGLAEYFA